MKCALSLLSRHYNVRPSRKAPRVKPIKPVLEVLEDRTVPVTNLNVVAGAVGSGTQDAGFLTDGQILFGDPDLGANTLSTGAMAQASTLFASLIIQADVDIRFTDIGTLTLVNTGLTFFSTATSGGGALTFATPTDTLQVNSTLDIRAQTDVVLANLLNNSSDVAVSAGGGIMLNGNLASSGFVGLSAGNGASQAAGGIKAAGLLLLGNGTFTLASAANAVGVLAGTVTGGTVDYVQQPGSLLTIDTIDIPGFGSATGLINIGHDVTLRADDMDIAQPINVGSGTLTLQTTATGVNIDLGGATSGTLSLTDQEFNNLTAATVIVGNSASNGDMRLIGAIKLAGPISLLDLRTGGSFSTPGGSLSTGGDLVISAGDNLSVQAGTTLAANLIDLFFSQDAAAVSPGIGFLAGNFVTSGALLVVSGASATRANLLQVDLASYTNSSDLVFDGQGADTFQCLGTAAADTFNVAGSPLGTDLTGALTATLIATEAVQLFGLAGSDTFNLGDLANSLDQLNAMFTVDGGAHNAAPTIDFNCGPDTNSLPSGDVLNLNDQGDADDNTYALNSASFQRTGIGTVNFLGVETVSVNAGTGSNTVTATTLASANTFITGNGGNDTFTVTAGAGANVQVDGLGGSDSLSLLGAGAGSITFLNGGDGDDLISIGQPGGSLDTLAGAVCADGGIGGDVIQVHDQGDLDDNTYTVNTTTLARTGAGLITSLNYEQLSLGTGTGNDAVDVLSTTLSTTVTIDGNDGDDLFILVSFSGPVNVAGNAGTNGLTGPNLANTWNITGTNAGTVGMATFGTVQHLTGGTNTDLFVFSDGAGVAGIVNGAGGTDMLDYAAYTTAVTVNLQLGGSATGTGGIANLEDFHGGSASDTFIGLDADSIFSFTAVDTASYNGTHTAASFENYAGGSGGDRFVFNNGVSVSGIINGFSSTGFVDGLTPPDTLDLSGLNGDNSFTLTNLGPILGYAGTAAPMGGFTNINRIIANGAATNDTLVGLDANATWVIGTAADSYASVSRTLAFSGIETFIGGTGNDLFNTSLGGGGLSTSLDILGGTGTDTFIGNATNADETFDVSGLGVFGSANVSLTDVENLALNTLGGNDVVNLDPTAGVNFTLDGGDPATAPGDTINLDVSGLAQPVVEVNGFNQTTLGLGDGFSNVTFQNFENVNAAGTYYVRMNLFQAGFAPDGKGDIIVVRLSTDGSQLELLVNGTTAYATDANSVRALTVRGSLDADILIVQEVNGRHVTEEFAGAPMALNSHVGGSHIHFDGNGPGGAADPEQQSMAGGGAQDRIIIVNTTSHSGSLAVDFSPVPGVAWLSGSISFFSGGEGPAALSTPDLLVSYESLGTSTSTAAMPSSLRAALRRTLAQAAGQQPVSPRQAAQEARRAARLAAQEARREAQAERRAARLLAQETRRAARNTPSPQAVSDALFALPSANPA